MKKFGYGLIFIASISSANAAPNPNYQQLVAQVYAKFKADARGKVADYIPALAQYSSDLYGVALVTVDGKVYTAGIVTTKFPLESLTKIFNLSLALQQSGAESVLTNVGSEATGLPFNSVVAVEQQPNHTGNALVNAGAMATVSFIHANSAAQKWDLILNNLSDYANSKLTVNQQVYTSETQTNQHNQAIAKLLQSYGRLYSDPKEAVDIYTRTCSIEANAIELARMGAVLANHGTSPFSGKQLLAANLVPNVLAEMATAGLYDSSGSWLYRVGLPAKSGVGGGIIAVAPGKFAIAVYSPPLDTAGNSVRGQEAIQYLAQQLNTNIFAN